MIRKVLLSTLVILSVQQVSAQYRTGYEELYDSDTVRSLKEHVSFLSSALLEGRKAGSEGEMLAAEYLGKALEESGAELITPLKGEVFGVKSDGDTLTSRNVAAVFQGWDPALSDEYIVVGARMDNLGTDSLTVNGEKTGRIYSGANGNASGVAMLIELARKLSTARLQMRRSVVLVGFGASREGFAGSWYFLNRSFPSPEKIDAMVELEGLGLDRLSIYTSSNEDMSAIARSLKSELLPIQAELTTIESYPGDHIVFYDKEIPSAVFTSGRYAEHDSERDKFSILDFDTMERSLEYVFSYVLKLSSGEKPSFHPLPKKEIPAGMVSWNDCDQKPVFLNSPDPSAFLEKWVYPYLKYPKYALDNGIQGRVIVDFVIDEKGNVVDVRIGRSVHTALDEEAIRVVSASPKWRPGRHRGKKVKVLLSIPVEFRLDKGKGSLGINGYKIK